MNFELKLNLRYNPYGVYEDLNIVSNMNTMYDQYPSYEIKILYIKNENNETSAEIFSKLSSSKQAKILEMKKRRDEKAHLNSTCRECLTCRICYIEKINCVLSCGHVLCHECAEKIDICHICREMIKERNTLYI